MRLKLIDFLKGYSIFTIVVYHLLQFFPLPSIGEKIISFGGSGIHVFILCSGFGLTLSQLNKPIGYFQFLKKRFFKIYFPYIIIVLISACVPFMYDSDDRWQAVLSHVFLFKMFDEGWMTSFGYQLWFVSMIIQLYFLFPFLFNWVKRYKWICVFCSLFISLAWATLVGFMQNENLRIWNSFFLQYLWEFVLGMMLAIKFKEDSSFIKVPAFKYLAIILFLAIGLVGYTGWVGGVLRLYNDIPILLAYLSISLIVFLIGNTFIWINAFFNYINKYSYEWYLLHMLVFLTTFHFFKHYLPTVIVGVVAFVLSFLLSIVFHKLLSKYVYSKFR